MEQIREEVLTMQFEFRVGDKRVIEPDFNVYSYKGRNNLLIVGVNGISTSDEEFFKQSLIDDQYHIEIQNQIVGLEIGDRLYSFDLRNVLDDFLKNLVGECFYIGFAFADENGMLKKSRMKTIKMVTA
jgi:hypothetical protein